MNHPGICVVTFPVGSSGAIPLSNLADVLCNIYSNPYIISSKKFEDTYVGRKNKINIIAISHRRTSNVVIRLINYCATQVKISWKLLRLSHKYDKCIFYLGGDGLIIPILLCRLLNKQVFLCLGGSASSVLKQTGDLLYPVYKITSYLSHTLVNKIILYSPRLIQAWDLEDYENSILIAHRHFLDFNTFTVTTPLPDRPPPHRLHRPVERGERRPELHLGSPSHPQRPAGSPCAHRWRWGVERGG